MTEQPENTWREALPKVNYVDKAFELSASFDRLMVTLFSTLIAGIVVMLLKEEVSLWVGATFVLALLCFALGIGHTLLHINFMNKMLLLAEALINGTELVPNAVEYEDPTAQAYARNEAYARRAFASQLIYLMMGVSFGALALIIRLWEYTWRAGVVGLSIVAIIFVVVAMIVTWKNTIRRFRPSTVTE